MSLKWYSDYKVHMKKADHTIEVGCSILFAALACWVAYRVLFDIPSEGSLEDAIRIGLRAIGSLAIILYMFEFLGWVWSKRK